jgi:hypothetical protein
MTHWRLIDRGAFAEAFASLHPAYATSEAEWIEAKRVERPDVAVETIRIEPSSHVALPGESWLTLEVATRDRGGVAAGNCRVFSGEVRMFQEDGRWTYRPGPYRGTEPSFARPELGGSIEDVPESDTRCP